MMNTWGVIFDGYKAPIVREVAGSVKEEADFKVGKSSRYKKKKENYLAEVAQAKSKAEAVINLFNKGLTEREISMSGFVSRWYARHVLKSNGLIGAAQ